MRRQPSSAATSRRGWRCRWARARDRNGLDVPVLSGLARASRRGVALRSRPGKPADDQDRVGAGTKSTSAGRTTVGREDRARAPPIGKPRRGRPSCHVRIAARCRNVRGHSELGAYIERAAGHRLPTALSGTAPVSATHFGSRKQGRRLSRLLMKFTVAFYPGDRAAIEFQHKQADGRRKISLLTLRLNCTSK